MMPHSRRVITWGPLVAASCCPWLRTTHGLLAHWAPGAGIERVLEKQSSHDLTRSTLFPSALHTAEDLCVPRSLWHLRVPHWRSLLVSLLVQPPLPWQEGLTTPWSTAVTSNEAQARVCAHEHTHRLER